MPPNICDLPTGASPADLRAVMTTFDARVIGIDAPANSADPWVESRLDAWVVALPWAASAPDPVSVVPIGWTAPDASAGMSVFDKAIDASRHKIESARDELKLAVQSHPDLKTMNTTNLSLARVYLSAARQAYGKPTPMDDLASKIGQNVLSLCQNNPGKSIILVLEPAHVPAVVDALARVGVVVVNSADWLEPAPDVLAKSVLAGDALLPFRRLSEASPSPDVLRQLSARWSDLQKISELAPDAMLLKGRLLFAEGKFKAALEVFSEVGQMDESILSLDLSKTPLYETGLVWSALTRRALGESEQANRDLRALLNIQKLTRRTRQWVQELLASTTTEP